MYLSFIEIYRSSGYVKTGWFCICQQHGVVCTLVASKPVYISSRGDHLLWCRQGSACCPVSSDWKSHVHYGLVRGRHYKAMACGLAAEQHGRG